MGEATNVRCPASGNPVSLFEMHRGYHVQMLRFLALPLLMAPLAAPGIRAEVSQDAPSPLLLNGQWLAENAGHVRAGDPALHCAFTNLVGQAEAAMTQGVFSVTHKTTMPPSGNKHDYVSYGRYWWPDPDQPDGLPYVRRDGETYPGSQGPASDRPRLGQMTDNVETLALAYHFTGDARYADHAARLITTWFLDPATRMTPHVKYAQGIPGVRDGGKSGLIDTRLFSKVIDAACLLSSSPALSPEERVALKAWFTSYLVWLQTGKNAVEEAATENNHGMWFDAQLANVALFVGETNLARTVLEAAVDKRLMPQVLPDGTQPRELARTRPLHYCIFNLEAMFALARLGEHVGVDLWRAGGSRVRAGLDFVAPYADTSKSWPYPTVKEADRTDLLPLLLQGAHVYGDRRYLELAAKLPAEQIAGCREHLTLSRER